MRTRIAASHSGIHGSCQPSGDGPVTPVASTSTRFVALRPPVAADTLEVIEPTAEALHALDEHVRNQTFPADSLEAAWRAVAWSIRGHQAHFRRIGWGREIIACTEPAIALLRQAQGMSQAQFRAAANTLGPPMNAGKPLESLVPDLRAPFLLGHWAWVLHADPAPQDGRITKLWLAMFHLVTAPDEAEWTRRRDRIPTLRIGLPASLLRLPVRAAAAAPPAGRSQSGRDDLITLAGKLKLHHVALRSLLDGKLAAASAGAKTKTVPWRVAEEDTKAHPELFQAVRSLGLDPAVTDIPTQLTALDQAVARLERDAAARRPGRVRLVGSTFLRTDDKDN